MKQEFRRRWQRLFCLIMVAGVVLMSGCSTPDGETMENGAGNVSGVSDDSVRAKGRYVESQVNTLENFNGKGKLGQLSDGSLVIVDIENGTKSTSKDEGKTWESEKVKKLQQLVNGGDAEITSVAVSDDGGLFYSYILWDKKVKGKNYPEKYVYENPKGSVTEFELGIEDYHACLTEAVFTEEGRLFVGTNSGTMYEINYRKKSYEQILSPDSGIEMGADMALCVNGDSLIVSDGIKVYFYNLKSGEFAAEDSVLNDYVEKQSQKKYGIVLCAAGNGKENQTLYLASCDGIAGHAIGGSVMEQLVDGALINLGDPSRTPRTMIQKEDGSFLIMYGDGELDSYIYDPEAPAVPERQITIYGLHDNETIRQAISVFRKKDSEILVKFEVGVSGENGVTESDAIKKLNTELLAGEGPDLILLDGMPLDSYQEKGILADLSGVVGDLENTGTYFDNILKGYQKNDIISAIPFRYRVPLIVGNSQILSKISDLKTLADEVVKLADQPGTEETVLGTYSEEELLEKLYPMSSGVWITPDRTVNKDALMEFFSQAKRIYEAEQKNLDQEEKDAHKEVISHLKGFYQDDDKVMEQLQSASKVFEQLRGTQVLTAGYLTDMMDFEEVTSVGKKVGGQSYQICNGQMADVFCPTGIIGMNVNSKRSEDAKAFISTLLGEDVQKKDLQDGFPVNADAYAVFTKNPTPESSMVTGAEDKNGNPFMLDIFWPGKQDIEQLKSMIQTLKTPAVTEDEWKKEVISIGSKALTGEKGVEDCVEEINQKILLHLQE